MSEHVKWFFGVRKFNVTGGNFGGRDDDEEFFPAGRLSLSLVNVEPKKKAKRKELYAGTMFLSFSCLQEFVPEKEAMKMRKSLNPDRAADSSSSCLSLAKSRSHMPPCEF